MNVNVEYDNNGLPIEDVQNSMCCNDEIPTTVGGAMFMFVVACSIGFVVLWCVAFRLKNGVWHMMCVFDNPPPTALLYTTDRNIVGGVVVLREDLREKKTKKEEIRELKKNLETEREAEQRRKGGGWTKRKLKRRFWGACFSRSVMVYIL